MSLCHSPVYSPLENASKGFQFWCIRGGRTIVLAPGITYATCQRYFTSALHVKWYVALWAETGCQSAPA